MQHLGKQSQNFEKGNSNLKKKFEKKSQNLKIFRKKKSEILRNKLKMLRIEIQNFMNN